MAAMRFRGSTPSFMVDLSADIFESSCKPSAHMDYESRQDQRRSAAEATNEDRRSAWIVAVNQGTVVSTWPGSTTA